MTQKLYQKHFSFDVLNETDFMILNFLWTKDGDGTTAYELKGWFDEVHGKKYSSAKIQKLCLSLKSKGYIRIEAQKSGNDKYFSVLTKDVFLHEFSRLFVMKYFNDSVFEFLDAYGVNVDIDSQKVLEAQERSAYAVRRTREGVEAAKAKGVRFGRPKKFAADKYFYVYEKVRSGAITVMQAVDEIGCKTATYYTMLDDFKKMYDEKYGTNAE